MPVRVLLALPFPDDARRQGEQEEDPAIRSLPYALGVIGPATMQVIPISKELVIQVAAEAAAPFALVWLFATPIDEIVRGLFRMFF